MSTPETAIVPSEPVIAPADDLEIIREPEYASRPIEVTTLFNRELTEIAKPPCRLVERYPDRVWRWMSKPEVDKLGMRGYTAYSPNDKEKSEIARGQNAGIRVTEANVIWWNEDAFLGWKPRRWFEQHKAQKRALIDDKTKLSRAPFRGASSMTVESTQAPFGKGSVEG